MDEDLLRLGAFFAVGSALWFVSLRIPMQEYGPQPVASIDRWFFVISLLMAGAYGWIVAPVVLGLFDLVRPWIDPLRQWASKAHPAAQVLLFALATDFLSYWTHRFMHTRWAWDLHAFHHSAQSLNWFSGMRGSPLHYVLLLSPGTLMASVILVAHDPWLLVGLAVFDAITQNLMHTNIRLPLARHLEWIFITPRMHFVHHHRDPRYSSSNYGFNFAIWDHLFGTYIDADNVPDKGQLGLTQPPSLGRLFLGLSAESHPSDPAEKI